MRTNEFPSFLHVEGINSKGYGIIPVMVMQDTNLTIEAKAIYAYFATLINGSIPSLNIETITKHLCISKNRYYKHLKLLIDRGYLKTESSLDSKTVSYVLQDVLPDNEI